MQIKNRVKRPGFPFVDSLKNTTVSVHFKPVPTNMPLFFRPKRQMTINSKKKPLSRKNGAAFTIIFNSVREQPFKNNVCSSKKSF
jgi:hypothetical protein